MLRDKGKLLIVDDEPIVRDSLGKWFHEEGYKIGTAESASEALTRLAERRWDLALVDIKMPGTDGIELQRRLREVDPDLIVVIMTGYASVGPTVSMASKMRIIAALWPTRFHGRPSATPSCVTLSRRRTFSRSARRCARAFRMSWAISSGSKGLVT